MLNHFVGAVGGHAVHQHDLVFIGRTGLVEQGFQGPFQDIFLVEASDNYTGFNHRPIFIFVIKA
jgi:hypothetical protein